MASKYSWGQSWIIISKMDRGNLKVIITFIIIIYLSKCTLIINIRGNTLLIDVTI